MPAHIPATKPKILFTALDAFCVAAGVELLVTANGKPHPEAFWTLVADWAFIVFFGLAPVLTVRKMRRTRPKMTISWQVSQSG